MAGLLCRAENGRKDRNKRPLYDAVVTKAPLIRITRFYRDVRGEEVVILRDGRDLDRRVTSVLLEFSPLWVDGIASFYLLKPVSLYKQIRALHHGKRISPAVFAFCDFLHAEPHTVQNRRAGSRNQALARPIPSSATTEEDPQDPDCAYWTAMELGLLERQEFDDFGLLLLFLNPAKCQRIKGTVVPDPAAPTEISHHV